MRLETQSHVSIEKLVWQALVGQYLVALPWEAALQQEEEGVCKGLQVISSAGSAPQVRMHAGIPHRPSVENALLASVSRT